MCIRTFPGMTNISPFNKFHDLAVDHRDMTLKKVRGRPKCMGKAT